MSYSNECVEYEFKDIKIVAGLPNEDIILLRIFYDILISVIYFTIGGIGLQ